MNIDTKVLATRSPATDRQRYKVVMITSAGEQTFMVFHPFEADMAQECARSIRNGSDNINQLRLAWSERRFNEEPLRQSRKGGRPRSETR